MELKNAILDKEKEQINTFLEQFSLSLDKDVTDSLYLEEAGEIIGTVSCSNYIIKCLAVKREYQNEQISSTLVSEIIKLLNQKNIYYYQVFTKKEYKNTFISYGFSLIAEGKRACVLEMGITNISDELKKIKSKLEHVCIGNLDNFKIGSLVVNANPVTMGHVSLIEKASLENDYVLVFLLEEERSIFSYQDRYALLYLSINHLNNVYIIPSTKYIVSSLTFPSYFIKDTEIRTKEHALIDAVIFRDYFMKYLNISKRYVGTEVKDYMQIYNETLKEVLKERLVLVDRYKIDGTTISASYVRSLLEKKQFGEASKYIPTQSLSLFNLIAGKLYGTSK